MRWRSPTQADELRSRDQALTAATANSLALAEQLQAVRAEGAAAIAKVTEEAEASAAAIRAEAMLAAEAGVETKLAELVQARTDAETPAAALRTSLAESEAGHQPLSRR